MESIRQNLRFIIHEKGIKQRSLAEKADIPEKTLSAMLNGRNDITEGTVDSGTDGKLSDDFIFTADTTVTTSSLGE